MLALVTGASSGIGLQYATQLARDYHCDLLLVSNQEKELKEGKEKEKSMASQIGSLEEKIDELTGAIAAGEKKLDKLETAIDMLRRKTGGKAVTRGFQKNEDIGIK